MPSGAVWVAQLGQAFRQELTPVCCDMELEMDVDPTTSLPPGLALLYGSYPYPAEIAGVPTTPGLYEFTICWWLRAQTRARPPRSEPSATMVRRCSSSVRVS